MTIDVTSIITAIIGVLGTIFAGLLTTYLVPWLKSKFTANQLSVISGLIINGVKAAETLFPASGAGTKKFNYVMDSIKSFCTAHHITFDETTVKNEIQSVWNDLYNKANPTATQVTENAKQSVVISQSISDETAEKVKSALESTQAAQKALSEAASKVTASTDNTVKTDAQATTQA